MGNKTVTPEKSRAPIYPVTDTDHYVSVNALYSDIPLGPRRSATPPVSYNSPTYAFPVNSTIENPYNYHPVPTTSPTFAFPVYSPTNAIPIGSPTAPAPIESPSVIIPIESPTGGGRIESPVATFPLEFSVTPNPIEPSTAAAPVKSPFSEIRKVPSTTEIPLNSPTPRFFVASSIPRTPVVSSSTVVPTNSPTAIVPVPSPSSKVPLPSSNSAIPLVSPLVVVPVNSPIAAPVASSSPDIPPIPSPIPNVNRFSVVSPDTSAVSPTLDLNTTPVTSPVPPKPVAPVKPVTFFNKNRAAARITHDAATSPMVRVVPNPRVMPRTSRAIPSTFRAVPSTTRSIPSTSRNIPSTSRNMPSTTRSMPSTTRAIPPTYRDIPSTTRVIPSNYRDPPSTYRDIPPTYRDMPSTYHDIPPTYHPSEVAPRRTILKNPIQPPISILKQPAPKTSIEPPVSILKQTKHSTLSSPDRSTKWYEFEQKQQEEQRRFAEVLERIENPSKSPVSSPSIISSPHVEIAPVIPDIIAVPSFSLRSTAVSHPTEDPQILSERTQSIHNDLTIFKYYLTYNEAKHAIGDHTKATMFQMDTRLKKTPLPAPSLSFLTKNFNDDTQEIKYHSDSTPAFETLGLQQNDLEYESLDQFPAEPPLHEKQRQRKLRQSSWRPTNTPDSNSSLQFVQSTVLSQTDFQGLEQNSAANNRQPLTSILKKPSTQFGANPFAPKPNNIIFQEIQNNDFEINNNNNDNNTNLSGVSFKFPSSSIRTKANQSISRSVRLTHRKK